MYPSTHLSLARNNGFALINTMVHSVVSDFSDKQAFIRLAAYDTTTSITHVHHLFLACRSYHWGYTTTV